MKALTKKIVVIAFPIDSHLHNQCHHMGNIQQQQ